MRWWLRYGCVTEEGDDDVAGDRDGRWRGACVYDSGWLPVKRERKVVFPEPVNDEEISWLM